MTARLVLLAGVPAPLLDALRPRLADRGLDAAVAGTADWPAEPVALARQLASRQPPLTGLVNGLATRLALPGEAPRLFPPYPLYEAAVRCLPPEGGCLVSLFDRRGLDQAAVRMLMGRTQPAHPGQRLCHNAMALNGPDTGPLLQARAETLLWLLTLPDCDPQGAFLRGYPLEEE